MDNFYGRYMCIIPYNERKAKFLKYPVKIAKPIMDNYGKHSRRSFNYHYVNYTQIQVFMNRILPYSRIFCVVYTKEKFL